MDDATYTVPKHDWRKTKFLGAKMEKKLDYISLFPDRLFPRHDQLTKIFAKKKNTVPGPEHYDTTRNWVKKSGKDYE